MRNGSFQGGSVPSCNSEGKLVLLMVYHIDDAAYCGRPDECRKMLEHLKSKVEVLEIGRMEEHLGVSYSLEKDNIGWYYECKMDKYIKKTVVEYEHDIKTTLSNYPTPAATGTILLKLDESIKKDDRVDQFRK
jgi:hypothetical protein